MKKQGKRINRKRKIIRPNKMRKNKVECIKRKLAPMDKKDKRKEMKREGIGNMMR